MQVTGSIDASSTISVKQVEVATGTAVSSSFAQKSAVSSSFVTSSAFTGNMGDISGSSTSTGSFGRVEVAGDLSVTGDGGGILQVKTLLEDTQEATTSGTFVSASSIDLSLTTSVANSHILVHYFTGMMYCPPAASELRATIYRTIGVTETDLRGDEDCLLLVSPGAGWQGGEIVYMDAPAQSANTTIRYQVWFLETGQSGAYIHYHQTKCLFQLKEISPSISTLTDSS